MNCKKNKKTQMNCTKDIKKNELCKSVQRRMNNKKKKRMNNRIKFIVVIKLAYLAVFL
jgi:predicted nucleic acid-binding Zn ribbon protein